MQGIINSRAEFVFNCYIEYTMEKGKARIYHLNIYKKEKTISRNLAGKHYLSHLSLGQCGFLERKNL